MESDQKLNEVVLLSGGNPNRDENKRILFNKFITALEAETIKKDFSFRTSSDALKVTKLSEDTSGNYFAFLTIMGNKLTEEEKSKLISTIYFGIKLSYDELLRFIDVYKTSNKSSKDCNYTNASRDYEMESHLKMEAEVKLFEAKYRNLFCDGSIEIVSDCLHNNDTTTLVGLDRFLKGNAIVCYLYYDREKDLKLFKNSRVDFTDYIASNFNATINNYPITIEELMIYISALREKNLFKRADLIYSIEQRYNSNNNIKQL